MCFICFLRSEIKCYITLIAPYINIETVQLAESCVVFNKKKKMKILF